MPSEMKTVQEFKAVSMGWVPVHYGEGRHAKLAEGESSSAMQFVPSAELALEAERRRPAQIMSRPYQKVTVYTMIFLPAPLCLRLVMTRAALLDRQTLRLPK